MSPLVRYYSALGGMAVSVLAAQLAGLLLARAEARLAILLLLVLIPLALLFGVYATLLCRCPKCRLRLAARRSGLTHGLPGRICPRCQTDLAVCAP